MIETNLQSLFTTDSLMILRGIIPCLSVIFIGYLTGRADRAEHEKTLSSLIFFVFSPCLVFVAIHRHAFRYSEVGTLAVAAILTVLFLVLPALAVMKQKKVTKKGKK